MEDRKGAMYAAEDKLHTILSQSFQVMIDESNAAKKAAAKPTVTPAATTNSITLEFKSPLEVMAVVVLLSGLTAVAVTAVLLLII
jgi:hypothetical protein